MAKEMLISTVSGKECRIAIVRNGALDELYVERASTASHVGNIYKARVVNVEPSIQAAFVDFGLSKHGFLHISDLHPQYFPNGMRMAVEDVGHKRPHYKRPPIQDCLKRGQEIVVQMTKEGIGSKGPTMTTYLSIPGRMLVMMPGMARMGISRKVEDEDARQQAKQTLAKLKLPNDIGFIVRTAGVGKSKRDIERDLNYLLRLWKSVKKQASAVKAPAEVYKESDLLIRTIRDVHNKDIDRIVCDDEETAKRSLEFLRVVAPRTTHRIDLYVGKEGLFHDYGIEREIEKIYTPRVELPSGGSLVIDQAEALVAIDVNSGRFREHTDAETTALKMNLEAAKEVARQLRLRDLGGVIVIDFIDMRDEKNRWAVERALREAVKVDRAKSKILKISSFGIVEMTRQRVGPSLKDSMYRMCGYCSGSGLIKSEESQALHVMRCLQRAAANDEIANLELSVTPAVAYHLANYQRSAICDLETRTGKSIVIKPDAALSGDDVFINCTNSRGTAVAWQDKPLEGPPKVEVRPISLEEMEATGQEEAEEAERPKQSRPPKQHKRSEKTDRGRSPDSAKIADRAEQPGQAEQAGRSPAAEQPKAMKSRRRGKRGGRKHRGKSEGAVGDRLSGASVQAPQAHSAEPAAPAALPRVGKSATKAGGDAAARAGEGGSRRHAAEQVAAAGQGDHQAAPAADQAGSTSQGPAAKKRRRGKRGGKKHRKKASAQPHNQEQ